MESECNIKYGDVVIPTYNKTEFESVQERTGIVNSKIKQLAQMKYGKVDYEALQKTI